MEPEPLQTARATAVAPPLAAQCFRFPPVLRPRDSASCQPRLQGSMASYTKAAQVSTERGPLPLFGTDCAGVAAAPRVAAVAWRAVVRERARARDGGAEGSHGWSEVATGLLPSPCRVAVFALRGPLAGPDSGQRVAFLLGIATGCRQRWLVVFVKRPLGK